MDFNKLIPSSELSSEDYHGAKGSYSSSQLKTMLKDPEIFHKKYIVGDSEKLSIPAFDIGTYFHCAVLEPEMLEKETIVFTGAIRRGKEWDEFAKKHKGKAILTKTEKDTAERLVGVVKASPVAMSYLSTSEPEVSCFVELYVLGEEIFGFRGDLCFLMSSTGWVESTDGYDAEDIKEFGIKVVIKVRADALDKERGIISDLKSTTGNTKDVHDMKTKVASYEYDLSASLYLDIFTLASGIDFDTFIWIFASKDKGEENSKSYKASHRNKLVGRAKWTKAVILLAKYISCGWEFSDELGELEPAAFSLEWLQ